MRTWQRFGGPVLLLGVPLVLLVVFRNRPSLDARNASLGFHVVVVGGIAACALVTALVAATTAARTRQPGPVLLAAGCLATGTFMLAHGLTTPSTLGQPHNLWVARLQYVALLGFALGMALAARPADRPLGRWIGRHATFVLAAAGLAFAAFSAVVVQDPLTLWGDRALPWEENVLDVVAVLVAVLGVRSTWTHWNRYQLGRDQVQLALSTAGAMTAAAATAIELGTLWQLSWWDYHAYLLGGFGLAAFAIVMRCRRARGIEEVLDGAFADDPLTHIATGYPEDLRRLVAAVEVKDAYTAGHSLRTAHLAVQLGERLGLSAPRLRVVARGAYLHDVGKIAVPGEILNKPGRLDAEELRTMQQHPRLGWEMARRSAALREVLDVILHHHEQFDGSGYPDGLAGSEIPLEARVVTVADVWDALTTDRSYRAAMPTPVALAHIVAGRGTHFDPAVVDAMVDLAAEQGIVGRDRMLGDAEVAWSAAQDCHHTASV